MWTSPEYTIKTSIIGTRIDMLRTLNLASEGKVKVRWQAFKLSEANNVLLKLKRGEILGKAVLVP